MPELPEVETIKSQLQTLVGKKVKDVEVNLSKLIKGVSEREFKKCVEGSKISSIRRRAKIVIINLSNNFSLLVHLKMTGQLIYAKKWHAKLATKHTHVIYHFSDGSALLHNDLRRFGYIKLMPTAKVDKFLEKEGLGPEPLEKSFTLEAFKKILARKQRVKIKPLLMDQKFIAGIGNIYGDEILFCAGVRPVRIVASLSVEEIKKIFQGIKKILPEAIRYRGTSADNYVDMYGQKGQYVPRLKVYGREDDQCFKCSGKVERLKIGGRSAHFCPQCQK